MKIANPFLLALPYVPADFLPALIGAELQEMVDVIFHYLGIKGFEGPDITI